MRVRAIARGFEGQFQRSVGDVFEISDARNEAGELIALGSWMELVSPGNPNAKPDLDVD